MRPASMAALVAAAAVSAGGAWLVLRPGAGPTTGAGSGAGSTSAGELAGGAALPASLTPALAAGAASAARVEITSDEGTLTLARSGEAWGIEERGGYPVPVDRIRRLLVQLDGLKPIEAKTATPENHARLGVDLPEPGSAAPLSVQPGTGPTRVRVLDGGGAALADVVLGTEVFQGNASRVFARRAEENQTYLAEGTVEAPARVVRWIERGVVRLDKAQVQRVEVTRADGEAYTIVAVPAAAPAEGDGAAGDVAEVPPPPAQFVLDPMPEGRGMSNEFIGGSVAGALGFLSVDDVRPAAEAPATEPLLTAVFTTSGGMTLTARVGLTGAEDEEDVKAWATFAAEGEGAAAVNEKAAGWAFEVPRFTWENLARRVADLTAAIEPEPGVGGGGAGELPALDEIPPALRPLPEGEGLGPGGAGDVGDDGPDPGQR